MAYRDLTLRYLHKRDTYIREKKEINYLKDNVSETKRLKAKYANLKEEYEPFLDIYDRDLEDNPVQDNNKNRFNTSKPEWMNNVSCILMNLKEIKQKSAYLGKLHALRLMIRFDDKEQFYDNEISHLTEIITNLFHSCEFHLKKINNNMNKKDLKITKQSFAEQKIKINVIHALASQFNESSRIFYKNQKEYLTKLQSQNNNNYSSSLDFLMNDKYINKQEFQQYNIHNDSIHLNDSNNIEDSCRIRPIDSSNIIIEERDEEILKIAKSINDLSLLFKQVASLVIDQGTVVDQIDYNMELVVTSVKKGMNELIKAEKYQKSDRASNCIYILLSCIGFCFLLLLIKHF